MVTAVYPPPTGIIASGSVMFFTAKIHLVSGIVISALAIMAAKQVCKQRKVHKQFTAPTKFEE